MLETEPGSLGAHNDLSSLDLPSLLFRRVGVAATLVVAGLTEWCLSQPKEQPNLPASNSAREAVPVHPLVAESSRAFKAGERMGKNILVYFNRYGFETHFSHTREFSPNIRGSEVQGGLSGWDVAVMDKGPVVQFEVSDFEAWREAQTAELKNRPSIREELETPGSGVLFSGEGSVFVSHLLGDRIQLRQVEGVEPLKLDGNEG